MLANVNVCRLSLLNHSNSEFQDSQDAPTSVHQVDDIGEIQGVGALDSRGDLHHSQKLDWHPPF
jgi:hypothetical protein